MPRAKCKGKKYVMIDQNGTLEIFHLAEALIPTLFTKKFGCG